MQPHSTRGWVVLLTLNVPLTRGMTAGRHCPAWARAAEGPASACIQPSPDCTPGVPRSLLPNRPPMWPIRNTDVGKQVYHHQVRHKDSSVISNSNSSNSCAGPQVCEASWLEAVACSAKMACRAGGQTDPGHRHHPHLGPPAKKRVTGSVRTCGMGGPAAPQLFSWFWETQARGKAGWGWRGPRAQVGPPLLGWRPRLPRAGDHTAGTGCGGWAVRLARGWFLLCPTLRDGSQSPRLLQPCWGQGCLAPRHGCQPQAQSRPWEHHTANALALKQGVSVSVLHQKPRANLPGLCSECTQGTRVGAGTAQHHPRAKPMEGGSASGTEGTAWQAHAQF